MSPPIDTTDPTVEARARHVVSRPSLRRGTQGTSGDTGQDHRSVQHQGKAHCNSPSSCQEHIPRRDQRHVRTAGVYIVVERRV